MTTLLYVQYVQYFMKTMTKLSSVTVYKSFNELGINKDMKLQLTVISPANLGSWTNERLAPGGMSPDDIYLRDSMMVWNVYKKVQ